MTDQTDIEDAHHPQRSVVVPVASARRGVEHLLTQGVVTAWFARARWPELVPVTDLRLPLATVKPEQRGDRVSASGGVCRVAGLRVLDPHFPTTTTPARSRWSGQGTLSPSGPSGGTSDSHRRTGESGGGPLWWACCLGGGRLHLFQPTDVLTAATAGHAQALCGRFLPVEGLILPGSSGALCLACIPGIVPYQQKREPDEHRLRGSQPRRFPCCAADQRLTSPEVTPTMLTGPDDPGAAADGTPIVQQHRIQQHRTP
jgi:hypothetical protein